MKRRLIEILDHQVNPRGVKSNEMAFEKKVDDFIASSCNQQLLQQHSRPIAALIYYAAMRILLNIRGKV